MTLPLAVNPFLFALTMTFGAAAIRGLTGFGMAIILVPLLGLVIEPAQAVVVAILLQLFIGPVGIGKIHADAETASAIPIAVIAMLATRLRSARPAHRSAAAGGTRACRRPCRPCSSPSAAAARGLP